jgi:23S rRNA (guanosine2251-2'-O)-methyltransferase
MKKLSMEDLNRISVKDYKDSDKINFCFVLDDIRSMSNVGSIFRTSDAFLVSSIYLCGISPTPPHREIEKTALGATESVEWHYYENVVDLILKLKKEGFKIYCLEQVENSINLLDFAPLSFEKYAIVLGNEVFGVKQEILNLAEGVIEIPQFGTKHSFNVSVSAGMVLWDYYSKTKGNTLDKPS